MTRPGRPGAAESRQPCGRPGPFPGRADGESGPQARHSAGRHGPAACCETLFRSEPLFRANAGAPSLARSRPGREAREAAVAAAARGGSGRPAPRPSPEPGPRQGPGSAVPAELHGLARDERPAGRQCPTDYSIRRPAPGRAVPSPPPAWPAPGGRPGPADAHTARCPPGPGGPRGGAASRRLAATGPRCARSSRRRATWSSRRSSRPRPWRGQGRRSTASPRRCLRRP